MSSNINEVNQNLTWGQLATINAARIMNLTGPFAHNQVKENLIHLKDGEIVGEWRDSTYGTHHLPLSSQTLINRLIMRQVLEEVAFPTM